MGLLENNLKKKEEEAEGFWLTREKETISLKGSRTNSK